MYNQNYSRICNHSRLSRIDDNFVRCLECGQSLVSQKKIPINKTRKQFTDENKSFVRNFNRNFSNIIEETDRESASPLYEYYSDRNLVNLIIINRSVQFASDPPVYEIFVNGEKRYLQNEPIQKILADINAIRIDEKLAKSKFKN